MGLTASQTVSGGSFSPAGSEDPLAAGPTLHPIAPPVAHLSLSFDEFAYGLAWGRSCRSQAGPPGWSTSFDQAWPLRTLSPPPIPPPSRGRVRVGGPHIDCRTLPEGAG